MATILGGALRPAVLTCLAALVLPALVQGECPPPPATSFLTAGQIGLFFDPLGTENCADLAVGVPVPVYVVARVPAGGVAEFEIPALEPSATLPGILIGDSSLPPGSPYLFVPAADICSRGRRPDETGCPVAEGGLLVIAASSLTAFAPITGTACFHTVCPTIAGTVARAPAYMRCDTQAEASFSGGEQMCVGFGAPPVQAESHSWGAVKSLYR